MENWKNIKGYDDYSVSDLGNIKNNKTGNILKKHDHPKGYDQVYFAGHTFLVHKIVCEAYHDNPENKPCVDHIDGDKKNNAAFNLRWATYHENNSNPNTSYKNSHDPWNKGLTGIVYNWSEEGRERLRLASKKAGETMRRKAEERRMSPEWQEMEEERKARDRQISKESYQRNKVYIRSKAMGMSVEEYAQWKEEQQARVKAKKEAHERALARKQYKLENPNWKEEERKRYEEENKDKIKERHRKYRQDHIEEIRAKDRERKRKKKEAS